jgi:predicted RNA methylase
MPSNRKPTPAHEADEAPSFHGKHVAVWQRRYVRRACVAHNDKRARDRHLDQYYTQASVAAYFYGIFLEHFDPDKFHLVEPSAGTGSFFRLMPAGSVAFDVEPKGLGIEMADFLEIHIESNRPLACVGNPPFGRNSSMAVRFFNHAALQANVIALILPRTFRKASVENRLARDFHLLHEEAVPDRAFLFRGRPYNVPAIFQIWCRSDQPRALRSVATEHPDFEFTTPNRARFAIQRVGARAGRIHHNFNLSPAAHYFIRGDVEATMRHLDFASVVGNVAGNPSLSKSEIVALYRAATGR